MPDSPIAVYSRSAHTPPTQPAARELSTGDTKAYSRSRTKMMSAKESTPNPSDIAKGSRLAFNFRRKACRVIGTLDGNGADQSAERSCADRNPNGAMPRVGSARRRYRCTPHSVSTLTSAPPPNASDTAQPDSWGIGVWITSPKNVALFPSRTKAKLIQGD